MGGTCTGAVLFYLNLKEQEMSEENTPENVYTLKAPISGKDGGKITALTLRKALAEDLMAAEKFNGNVASTLAMMSSMTGIPMNYLQKMEADDFEGADEKMASLLGNSRDQAG